MQNRDTFGTKLGIVAAAAGSAIGLGNIWKFPYMVGNNGGSAFIFIYLLATILMGYPLIYTELSIGRFTSVNAVDAFGAVGKNKKYNILGWFVTATVFIVLTFYIMIAGWVIYYLGASLTGSLYAIPEGVEAVTHFNDFFAGMNQNIAWPILGSVLAIGLTGFVNISGIKGGVEKYSKILMPILFVIFIILIGYSTTLDGFDDALVFLFKPDFSEINLSVVIAAIGQAFFSLSLGMGLLITYGSYIPKNENINSISKQVIIADTVIALFSGLLIFPVVFTFGGSPDAGPSLLFKSLPQVFNQMAGGRWFGALFFLLVIVAAITSLISMVEIMVTVVSEKFNWSRKVATLSIAGAGLVGAIINILGEGPLAAIQIAGMSIFGFLDFITNNIAIPLGGVCTAVIGLWVWKASNLSKEFTNDGKYPSPTLGFFNFLLKWIIPPAIIILIISMLF
ncbi:MAG: sodium-dependent transporter [Cellulosilyticaceae bacterium]